MADALISHRAIIFAAIIDILLPKMGESVAEAMITKLVVGAGAGVEADEPIVETPPTKWILKFLPPKTGRLSNGAWRRETWYRSARSLPVTTWVGTPPMLHLHRPLLRHQAHLLHLSQLQNLPRRQKWLLQPWRLLTMHLREKDLPAVSIRLWFGALPKKRASA